MDRTHRLSNRGFTLVELIIVIAIIAVLGAVLAPQYIKYVDRSRETVCQSSIQELEHAYLVDYSFDSQSPASTLEEVMTGAGLTKVEDAASMKYSGGCPKDGIYTVTLDDNGAITAFTCSQHGAQRLEPLTDLDKGVTFLKQAFQSFYDANGGLLNHGTRMDSNGYGVVDEFRPLLETLLKSNGYQMTDTTIWRVSWQKDAAGNAQMKVYWADPGEKLTLDNYNKLSGVQGKQIDITGDSSATKDATVYFGKSSKGDYVVINNNLNFTS